MIVVSSAIIITAHKKDSNETLHGPHAGMADGESLMASTPAPATEEKMINGVLRSLVAQRLLRRLLRSLASNRSHVTRKPYLGGSCNE